jgi:hypothetical protein
MPELRRPATGRILKAQKRKRRPPRKIVLTEIEAKNAFSIDEFCARNGISRATYGNYRRAGIGPVESRALRAVESRPRGRVTITREAEAAWHYMLQNRSMPARGRPKKVGEASPTSTEA